MLDFDREDIEWDESLRAHAEAADLDRAIRPLPTKRQRLLPDAPPVELPTTQKSRVAPGKRERYDRDAVESDDSFDPVVTHEPTRENRPSAGRFGDDSRAINHTPPPRARSPPPGETDLADGADSSKASHNPSTTSDDSAPTSPSSRLSASLGSQDSYGRAPRGPDYFPVFGHVGDHMVRSLAAASAFSPAGLFGGLGLAALHPSLAPPSERDSVEDEEDEDGYPIVRERSYAERSVGVLVAVDGVVGSNKKKRKIPGVNPSSNGDDDDRGFDGEDDPEPAAYKALGTRSDFSTELVVKGPPPDAPKTAKAALAKLRVRPPHVSLSRAALSHRRYALRHQRDSLTHEPLSLPTPTLYVPPASYSTGPPPLPPGSGLKGSRALKAAKKAEKDREREKDRIRKLLGGDKLKIPNLWDPLGVEAAAAAAARGVRRKSVAQVKSGYLTPPASSDEGEVDSLPDRLGKSRSLLPRSPPTLIAFAFSQAAPPSIAFRWKSLRDQIEQLRISKERAARAREEERERRKEKEREQDAPQGAEADESSGQTPTPAATPKRTLPGVPGRPGPPGVRATSEGATPTRGDVKRLPASASASPKATKTSAHDHNVALHPGVEPLGDRSSFPPSTTTTSTSTVEPMPLSRKPPLKKGRKKRSAHANANNSHHRSNYVPSRIPTSSVPHVPQYDPSLPPPLTSWPASDEAIAAAGGNKGPGAAYFAGPDEWLCMFCEYEIFYGEESLLGRAVRKRKNVLKVRSRARERASKAANGPAPLPADSTTAPPAATT